MPSVQKPRDVHFRRQGRNPQTEERVTIEVKKTSAYEVEATLKAAVNK